MGLTFIKSLTADDDCELEFIDGTGGVVFDNTYNEYQFQFVNIHPVDDNVDFSFQVNSTNDPASGDGAYDTSLITSTHFAAYHHETSGVAALAYDVEVDLAQEANEQVLGRYFGNEDDESGSGVLTLYDPSSTTYVKHFTSRLQVLTRNQYFHDRHIAGYINDPDYAIDEIRFKFSGGNIDKGTIYMYGVS